MIGRRVVVEYRDTPLSAGWHKSVWDGRSENGVQVPSGMYFYRLTHTPFEGGGAPRRGMSQTRKMLLVR